MWQKQYEKGRWNGHVLNILSTSIEGGHRLHISDIPYSDLPHIQSLGEKSRSIKLEVVFVGSDSLIKANQFIDEISANPTGNLEHPWLGEMPLLLDSFTQSLSTKRGVVTLSLTFVRAGKAVDIKSTQNTQSNVPAQKQASAIARFSSARFEREMPQRELAQLNETQEFAHQSLDVLGEINARLAITNAERKAINSHLTHARLAISSLAQAPHEFTQHFILTTEALAQAAQKTPVTNAVVDPNRAAQQQIISTITNNYLVEHINVLLILVAITINKEIQQLERVEHIDATTFPDPVRSEKDVAQLIESLNERIDNATQESTQESLVLYHGLAQLKGHLVQQQQKIKDAIKPQRTLYSPHYQPALAIAHQVETNERLLCAINPAQHPLFMSGKIGVRHE